MKTNNFYIQFSPKEGRYILGRLFGTRISWFPGGFQFPWQAKDEAYRHCPDAVILYS